MRITRREIPGGNAGIMATVETMRDLAVAGSNDPEVVAWAEGLAVGSCCPSVVIEQIRKFLTTFIRFEPDPVGVELVRDPLYMLRQVGRLRYSEGDCDDTATLGAALGLANELPARFRLLSLDESLVYSHVFVELWSGTGTDWVPLDTTAPAQFPPGMEVWAEETVEV